MTPLFRSICFGLLPALGIGPGFLGALCAQTPPVPPSHLASANAGQLPPMPPLPKSPVDSFRELLAMKPGEREQYLASRPPKIRERFLAKIKEYEALKPDERELRLRATQLRWYLLPLMQTPPTNRVAQLAAVPESDRQIVSERLRQWDLLPPTLQKQFLEYGLTSSYFVGRDSDHSEAPPKVPLAQMLPPDLVKKMDYVSKLPPDQRRQMYAGFQHFFELTDADRQKTLDTLSPAERQQMQKTLLAFMRLPKNERDECLQSFGKFTSMTDQERREFFKNAERWKELPPAEREAWRNLVNRFPPLPPIRPPSPPLPPMHAAAPRPGVPVATNQSP